MFIKITAKINKEKKEYIICKEKVALISLDKNSVLILLNNSSSITYNFNSNQDAKVFFDDFSKEFDIRKEF